MEELDVVTGLDYSVLLNRDLWFNWAVGVFGTIMHTFKKYAQCDTEMNFFQYLSAEKKHTVMTIISFTGAWLLLISGTGIDIYSWGGAYTALLTGFSANSAVNKFADESELSNFGGPDLEKVKRGVVEDDDEEFLQIEDEIEIPEDIWEREYE